MNPDGPPTATGRTTASTPSSTACWAPPTRSWPAPRRRAAHHRQMDRRDIPSSTRRGAEGRASPMPSRPKLYQRAVGYEHGRRPCSTAASERVNYTQHYAPDTRACIFWLRNRRRGPWRERHRARAYRHGRSIVAALDAASESGRPRAGPRGATQGRCAQDSKPAAMLHGRSSRPLAHRFDPLGYVMYAFPWGVPGTALADEQGPEPWQREILRTAGRGPDQRPPRPCAPPSLRAMASASRRWCRGSSCGRCRPCATRAASSPPTPRASCAPRPGPSSPSGTRSAINRDWFTYTATALHSTLPGHDKTWRVDAITWSENNTEAIAGLHNKGRRAFALFDEASAIPDGVWETIEGALTDAGTEIFWCVFGNPTRNTGRFRECFAGGRFAHRWQPRQIDSRSVVDDQQGADRAMGEGLRRGLRLRPRARARRVPARRRPAVHRQRARRGGRRARAGRTDRTRRWSWASTSPARAATRP